MGRGGGWGFLGRGGLAGGWFDRLTRDARRGLVVGCCWVPAVDAGMTARAVTPGAVAGRHRSGAEVCAESVEWRAAGASPNLGTADRRV